MKELEKFEPGDQILYVPTHAKGDREHPDVERGFVTGRNDKFVFCRFFYNRRAPAELCGQLRTRANSEAVYPRDLQHDHFARPRLEIEALLKGLGYNDD